MTRKMRRSLRKRSKMTLKEFRVIKKAIDEKATKSPQKALEDARILSLEVLRQTFKKNKSARFMARETRLLIINLEEKAGKA